MDEYKKFLADRLLSEEQPITYRLLSRALNIHVNTAKEMLYDFYQYQNSQKSNSVHATYLVYGTKSAHDEGSNGDVEMTGASSENGDTSEEVPAATLTLVSEERLKDVLSQYREVSSVHLYSLAPHPQKDLALLSDVARSVAEYVTKEDSSTAAKVYGTITNPQVRRRNTKLVQPAAQSTTAAKVKARPESKLKQEITAPKPATTTSIKKEEANATSQTTTPSSSAGKPPPTMKRGGSGGIMQAFAKAPPKSSKPTPAAKKEEEDQSMAMSDDGEADEMDIEPPTKKEPAENEAARQSRKERQEALRKMMEDDDEESENEKEEEEEEPVDAEMEDAAPEPEAKQEAKKEHEPAEVVASSGNGRRRGRRQVMKKERKIDDQGYMVTIQTQGWESFSEDEAPPPKKPAPSTAPPSAAANKAKKPAGKGGQGSIMSFFGKK